MKILWFTWKDRNHPEAGGAEFINEEIARRLVRDGHEVIFLVAGFPGSQTEYMRDGYKVIRLGNRYTVYWHAYRHYKRCLKGWADLVIDEMNTIPFFCKYYVEERTILLAYQLCRQIWFYQMRFPLSIIGYLVEPIYLRFLRGMHVITESNSTLQDLLKYGFSEENISLFKVGISARPLDDLESVKKFTHPTVLSLGSIRAMKRTLDQISAFETAKAYIPNLRLKIAGSASDIYGQRVLRRISKSTYASDIEYLGRVNEVTKTELMQRSHLILVTSVKEGWGLIVTEANSQGTPAAVYDVDGLRDSVKNRETGLITNNNNPNELGKAIVESLRDEDLYRRLRVNAWKWSRSFTLENCYQDFSNKVGLP